MSDQINEARKTMSDHVEAANDSPTSLEADETIQRGALLLEEERELGVWATIKLHWRPLLFCSVSFTSAMMFGYDSIVNGASLALPSFFVYFGSTGPTGPYLPSIWTSLWSAMSSAAQAIGTFGVGYLMDRFGRKWVGSSFALLTIVGTAVQYTSHSRGVLLVGKMINGFGVGAVNAVGTTYASEVAPLKLRGPIQQGIVLFTVIMFAVALGIVRVFVPSIEEKAFRTVIAIQWVVGFIAAIAFALVPESPVYLINKNHLEAAQSAMKKLYGKDNAIDARTANLIKTIREEQAQKELESGSYLDCFKGDNLKRTLTAIFIYSSNNLGGAAFLAQAAIFLIIAGLPAIHTFDITIGGFGLAIVIVIASWFVAPYFRKRDAFLAGCIINFIIMVIVGGLYYAPGMGPLWAIAVLMNLLITLQTSLLQAMGFPIAAEISSYRVRGKTISLAFISSQISTWLTQFLVPFMYNTDSGNLGARTGFVFAGLSVFLVVIAYYLVPDTTTMTMAEIDQAYADKVKPKDFRKALDAGRIISEGRRISVQSADQKV